jgi:putative tryptophan/tyrosine transport system substrate-binding protein
VRRREFIALVGSLAVSGPLAARAQQAGKMRLIGVLMGFAETDPAAQSLVTEFTGELTRLGWKSGGNLSIEVRWGAGDTDRIRALAKELVNLHPDAIFGQTTPVIDALARETQNIPIVFVTVSDPVGSGFATSLTHPGGNITGFTFVESAMGGKWVELLREIAPSTGHVALLFNPATAPPLKFYMPSIQAAASSFGIRVLVTPVHAKEEIEVIVAAQARDAGGSLIVMPDAFNAANHDLIISLVARYGVPALYGNDFARSGGLISYGSDFAETFHLAAGYIDRILKGTKAGELPIQLPTKFNLTLNLKTAKALGLTVPRSLLSVADDVIE